MDGSADGAPESSTDPVDGPVFDVSPSVDAGCNSSADCIPSIPTHPQVACDTSTRSCIQLTSDECPLVIGDYSGKLAAPIFLGAFATLPASAPQSHPSYLNYTLAIKEFTTAGGIPGWDPTKRAAGLRMPVAVVCNAGADIHAAVVHLASTVHVPAVVAALDSLTLRTTFVNELYPAKIFTVNPFGADSTLTSLNTDGLLWHMLGQPRDNAAAYAAFLPRIEARLRSSVASSEPLRVATVTADATATQDLAAAALRVMRWNGKSVDENTADGNYKNVSLDSVLSGADLANIDVSAPVRALMAFKPHIVVSFASSEFGKLLQVMELQWVPATSGPNPFYLLGPYNMESRDILTWVGAGEGVQAESKRTRLAGIGIASASDRHAVNAYESRFLGQFLNGQTALGQENYYDAMYFTVHSMVAAGRLSTLGGGDVAQGMLRLLSGTSYDVGPVDMGNIFGALSSPNGTLSLFGTLGPPSFTRATGARIGDGSVYCVGRDANTSSPLYTYDVLRLAESTDGGAATLQGTFPCYGGI